MAITYLKAVSATLPNASNTITVVGENVDFSKVNDYLVAIDNGLYVLPVLSGTAPDVNGDSTITLVDTWTGVTLTSKGLMVFPTFAKIYESVAAMTSLNDITRAVLLKLNNLLTDTTATLPITVGQTTTITTTPYGYLSNQVQALITQLNSLVGSVQAMTKSEFDALAEKRIRDNAGSGFLEFGKHYSGFGKVNEGIVADVALGANIFAINRTSGGSSAVGSSKSDYAIELVNGVEIHLKRVGTVGSSWENIITLPPAPDGLDKADGTGRFTDLAAAIVAGTTALNASVITREDLVLCKLIKAVDISVEDAWFPLGNRQFGVANFDGISLVNTNTTQANSAFGSWDTVTKGYSKKVSTSSAADLTTAYQNNKNNIYSDNGIIKQDQYQIVVQQGLRDYVDEADAMAAFGYTKDATDKGLWTDGTDLFIPIALVQRRNQGAGHPLNPDGCALVQGATNLDSGKFWWLSSADTILNVSEAFSKTSNAPSNTSVVTASGAIGSTSGRWNSDGKFYDAIYAEDIKDLRNSARRKTPYELLSYSEMAFSGNVRGFESVPFTEIIQLNTIGGTGTSGRLSLVYILDTKLPTFTGNTSLMYWIVNTTNGQIAQIDSTRSGTPLVTLDKAIGLKSVSSSEVNNFNFSKQFYAENPNGFPTGNTATSNTVNFGAVGDSVAILKMTLQTSKSESPTHTDIIGTPANILATFPNGVEGQVIPDLTVGNVSRSLNRKSLATIANVETTIDNGVTFTATTPTITSNAVTADIANVSLVHYKTKAKFLTDAVIADNEAIGDVTVMQSLNIFSGNSLFESLFDKVNVNNGTLTDTRAPLDTLPLLGKKLDTNILPTHSPLYIQHGTGNNVGKALFTITKENGQYFGQYLAKELIWGGTDWGDNNKIPVVNNTTTVADLNATQVIATNKRFKLPYFTGEA